MPNNILQTVQTYNDSNLASLLNSYAFIGTANMKFKDFDKMEKNLGDTVVMDLPPRFTTNNSLVASFQSAEQRALSLTVDQAASTAYDFSAQQFIFNAREYMDKFGKAAMAEIGTKIESNVASVAESNTFRFFGDGISGVSTYANLASALALFRNFGAAKDNCKAFLDDITIPSIVNSGLSQFALDRNNKDAMSWDIGRFSNCDWYQSNLLTTHIAGTEGDQASVLTVAAVTKNAEGGVTGITFSGTNAALDPDSMKQFDKCQFNDGVAGQPNMRFLTFIGHGVSQSPVQFRVEADATSSAGNLVTVSCFPALQATAGKNQNVNNEVAVGMEVSVLPSHRCGMIMAGNPLFMAMPRLPEEVPFPTAISQDSDSGAAIRTYYGSLFGQNQRGMVHDAIWGKALADEYAMMIALPL